MAKIYATCGHDVTGERWYHCEWDDEKQDLFEGVTVAVLMQGTLCDKCYESMRDDVVILSVMR